MMTLLLADTVKELRVGIHLHKSPPAPTLPFTIVSDSFLSDSDETAYST